MTVLSGSSCSVAARFGEHRHRMRRHVIPHTHGPQIGSAAAAGKMPAQMGNGRVTGDR